MSSLNLSIGQLVDLCRGGDINFRFSSRSSAREGIHGHQIVQKSRPAGYEAEYPVGAVLVCDGQEVQLRGRIDGLDRTGPIPIVDEIKTLRIAIEDIPQAVMEAYWHQAMLYGYLLSIEMQSPEVMLRLCFYHLDEAREYQQQRIFSARELHQRFVDTLAIFEYDLQTRNTWKQMRDTRLAQIEFPYGGFRSGQRDMAVSIFRAIANHDQLVLQAPTGIGKTMGALFPAVQALAREQIERVFYLSARGSTQQEAEKAISDIRREGADIRLVTITAKEKVCFSPGQPCHPDFCEFAKGYYDRRRESLAEMLTTEQHFDRGTIAQHAAEHELCPFELSLDLASQADVIISDYNYVFDPVVYLRRFFDSVKPDSAILVDEAHNLVDRGREMFSAVLEKEQFLELTRASEGQAAGVVRAARRVNREILALRKPHLDLFEERGFLQLSELPEAVLRALGAFCNESETTLRLEQSSDNTSLLLSAYFESLRFIRTAESFSDDYVVVLVRVGKSTRLKLYCVNPARKLSEGFGRLAAAICFSATLRPAAYFRKLLGVSEQAAWYQLESPFPRHNLQVVSAPFINTAYRYRQESVPLLVDLIHKVLCSRPGNYLVFFPSYQYMEMVYAAYTIRFGAAGLICQSRSMQEDQRAEFLSRYSQSGSAVCGFAVMGGLFAEGVDLKGDRLIGVIVVGVGLPQIGYERDLIKAHFPESGFEYGYQYPGIIKVLQTAGRVIRDHTDRGVVCLVDPRFEEHSYRSLLPREWQIDRAGSLDQLTNILDRFWSAGDDAQSGQRLDRDNP